MTSNLEVGRKHKITKWEKNALRRLDYYHKKEFGCKVARSFEELLFRNGFKQQKPHTTRRRREGERLVPESK